MIRTLSTAVALSIVLISAAHAQDGPLRRVGRAFNRTGRNIRVNVENEVFRGQINAQEWEILHRVGKRIEWDKQLIGSAMRLEAQPGGVVILQGSVLTAAAKMRAVDIVEYTIGVTTVVDQLAVVEEVRVIEAVPRVIESKPEVIEVETPRTKVIVEP